MKDRLARLGLPAAAALSIATAVLAAIGHLAAAVAVLGVALAVALVGLHLRLSMVLREQRARSTRMQKALADHEATVRRQTGVVRGDIAAARVHLDTLPSDIVYLQRLLDAVTPDDRPLPALGHWAATTRSVLAIAEEIRRLGRPVTILDVGSGSSTVLAALVVRARGLGGQVWALDADPAFAEETRGYLRDHGVDEFATVVDAPLIDVDLPDGSTALWYDLAGLPDIGPVDILFVDGPIGALASQVRYPAFPLLADRLREGALVVLDDTDRADERAIVRRWLGMEASGRRLEKDRVQGRATLMRARAVS